MQAVAEVGTQELEHSRRIHARSNSPACHGTLEARNPGGLLVRILRRYYSKQPRGTNEGSDLTRNGHVSALCKLKTVTGGRCQSRPTRSWRIVSQDQGDRPMSF